MIAAIWKNDLRHWLIWINFVVVRRVDHLRRALGARRRSARRREEKTPANLTPFLAGRRSREPPARTCAGLGADLRGDLRDLAADLLAAGADPSAPVGELLRQERRRPGRGAVRQLREPRVQRGGLAAVRELPRAKGRGRCRPAPRSTACKVNWKVPPLNTEALRFEEDTDCLSQSRRQPNTICDLSDIITYGRPGTPMQPWGVVGGGPKNDQSIADLVAYIESIQITPKQSQDAEAAALDAGARPTTAPKSCPEYMTCPGIELANAKTALADGEDGSRQRSATAAQKALNVTDVDRRRRSRRSAPTSRTRPTRRRPRSRVIALDTGGRVRRLPRRGQDREDRPGERRLVDGVEETQRANVTDGQLLFELNCARCHTEGWSVFDPTVPPGPGAVEQRRHPRSRRAVAAAPAAASASTCATATSMRRFGTDAAGGFAARSTSSATARRRSSPTATSASAPGKMPGFGQVPTAAVALARGDADADQIKQIVYYERYCLDSTTYTAVSPACDPGRATASAPQTPPTTTTTVKKG